MTTPPATATAPMAPAVPMRPAKEISTIDSRGTVILDMILGTAKLSIRLVIFILTKVVKTHSILETVAKVNSLLDFGGKADKRHFDRAEKVKCKALRVIAQGVYFR
ncbi:hypothetical protein [Porphyromonas pogonae]|uniref:hypothetical protein n=1 Tax=Porphyromonas pogonae TaxID=867595 RepID=UPI002E781FB2|nr:hypothetical protein [Porphyromonas pogonae]